MPGVVEKDAVGAARSRANIAVTVEHGEAVALLEGLSWPDGGGSTWNVKRSFRDLLGRD
jgi:hypothetical protein